MMINNDEKQDETKLILSDTSAAMSVLGFICRRYSSGEIQKNEIKDGNPLTTTASLNIWYADKLVFDVPDVLHAIQMVPLFTNDHIALGSDIKIKAAGRELSLSTRAISIKKGHIRKSVFRFPKGFSVRLDD
jgi:hypothetical protein